MEPTNAFTAMAMATKPTAASRPAKAAKATVLPDGSGFFTATIGAPKKSAPRPGTNRSPPQRHNPQTAASGVPRAAGNHPERQNDGNRTQQYSKPVKGGGLAERQPAPQPHANSRDARSGLEGAMAGLADQLHPRGRPKSTQRRK